VNQHKRNKNVTENFIDRLLEMEEPNYKKISSWRKLRDVFALKIGPH
jgi:hypothetical protein